MSEQYPSTHDEIEPKIAQSERDGGYWLKDLAIGHKLGVLTEHHFYIIARGQENYYISGHPVICPEPTECNIAGSTWGGKMLKMKFVGRGMYLEYRIGEKTYLTSQILDMGEMQ